ncbi:MAG: hypothetical protein ACOYNC_18885 [Bacteroidales bacterium]
MKKTTLLFALICISALAFTQNTHYFESVTFTGGGEVHQCAFAPTTLTFNNTNYVSFPGFGTTHTTAAYGDHAHPGMYEPVITPGTTLQYWRGDKTWQTFTAAVTPADQILDWDGAKYLPYVGKKGSDPGYPYFYTNPAAYAYPTFQNHMMLDGWFYSTGSTFGNSSINNTSVSTGGLAILNYVSSKPNYFAVETDKTSGENRISAHRELTGSSHVSLPIKIGDYTTVYGRVNEHIIVDPASQLFDVNMSTIRLSKGTAGKFLQLNGNKDITYVDPPVSGITGISAELPLEVMPGPIPYISMPPATWATNGYLLMDDYNAFVDKVHRVTVELPLQCTGGTEPEIHMLRATNITSGYIHKDDFLRFNTAATGHNDGYLTAADWTSFADKVSSPWEVEAGGIAYNAGNVGINVKNAAKKFMVGGDFDLTDFKTVSSNISKVTGTAGTTTISGIWQDAIVPAPNGAFTVNHSVVASASGGSYFYYWEPGVNGYNYQVGIFDCLNQRKAFSGIMGGGMPVQPYVDLGSKVYPWGRGFFADSLHTKNVQIMGSIGIGTSTMTNAINIDGTTHRKIAVNTNTVAATTGSFLTLEAGSTAVGNTNKPGGDIVLNGGTSTGNKTSNFVVNLPNQGASGTATNPLQEVLRLSGMGGFQLNSQYIYYPQIIITAYNSNSAPYMNFQHAGGTMASPLNASSWSGMGTFIWRPRLRGAFTNTAMFQATLVDSTMAPGSTVPSTNINFTSTNKSGAFHNYYFDENGYFGISPASANLPTTFLDIVGDKMRLRNQKTPASATAAGNPGDFCFDANYLYYCTALNTWKRTALTTW